MTTYHTTVEDLSTTEERRLEEFKTYYNHDTLEEALDDLKEAVKAFEKGEFGVPESLDIEMDIVYAIADREELEPEEEVQWCAACGDVLVLSPGNIVESIGYAPSLARHVENEGMICGACVEHDETEPIATVFYSDEPDYPRTIGHYHDRTEGEFEVESTRHDAWRVSHSVVPADEDRWDELHTDDVILSMSKDAKELKALDDKLMDYARDHGIRLARATARTSNVFSTTYNLYVDTESASRDVLTELKLYAAGLDATHRDDARFRATALTGKDPEQLEDHDEKFLAAVREFRNGDVETPREAVEKIEKREVGGVHE